MTKALIWRVPETWSAPRFAARPWLYPALYLRARGDQTYFTRTLRPNAFTQALGLVLVTDDLLKPKDLALLQAATAANVKRFILPLHGLTPSEVRTVEGLDVAICSQREGGLCASSPLSTPDRVPLSAGAVRMAEEDMLARELEYAPPRPFARSRWSGRYLVVVAESRESLLGVMATVAAAAKRDGLRIVVVADEPLLLGELPDGFEDAIVVNDRDPRLLALVAAAHTFIGAFEGAALTSMLPGSWIRTALQLGIPAITTSHPSVDSVAAYCVVDDIERGLALARHPDERAALVGRGLSAMENRLAPEQLLKPWGKALKRKEKPTPTRLSPRVTLLTLIDLPQDVDVLLPVLKALHDRRVAHLKIVVTDWLETEAPRTLALLRDAGLVFELAPRTPIRKGQSPSLSEVDGVLSACESTAGPHRAGRWLAERANAAGLSSFTLQHGFENIGLNYRDHQYGADIRFASKVVFTWGSPSALPAWVAEETRHKAVGLGSPKPTVRPQDAPPLSELAPGFARYIGVFENLHWDRYDSTYRERFLADVGLAAEHHPDTCFLIKPHQAGRWLTKNPELLVKRDNVLVIDPLAERWAPYTAPTLIAALERVITTPSTVALDAARAGRPVAVAAYGLALDAYQPLPLLNDATNWRAFLNAVPESFLARNEQFLRNTLVAGRAHQRIAGAIEAGMVADLAVRRCSAQAETIAATKG